MPTPPPPDDDAPHTLTLNPMLDRVVVVLCEPQDPINIGTTVRAMKNMGLRRLRLVRPANPNAKAIAISAPRAEDVIDAITHHDTLDDALADTVFSAALTARSRHARWETRRPDEVAPELLARAQDGPVALIFGREDRGLTNAQIERATRAVTIPTHPDYSSLNLAQAVLMMAHAVFLEAHTLPPLPPAKKAAPLATQAELEGLQGQAEATLRRIEFIKSGPGHSVTRSLRSIFQRADLDQREVRLLRGVFSELEAYVDRATARPDAAPPQDAP